MSDTTIHMIRRAREVIAEDAGGELPDAERMLHELAIRAIVRNPARWLVLSALTAQTFHDHTAATRAWLRSSKRDPFARRIDLFAASTESARHWPPAGTGVTPLPSVPAHSSPAGSTGPSSPQATTPMVAPAGDHPR